MTTEELELPCPFECEGTAVFQEDDYNEAYACPDCEGWFMPRCKPLKSVTTLQEGIHHLSLEVAVMEDIASKHPPHPHDKFYKKLKGYKAILEKVQKE